MERIDREQFFERLGNLPHGDLRAVMLAYWLSKDAHRVQTRDDGGRYFEHPRAVALLLIEHGYRSGTVIVQALLHDVVEDTFVPPEAIVSLFGKEAWRGLFLLSKRVPTFDPVTGKLIGRTKKSDDEYYDDISSAEVGTRLVKCADRRHNLRTMSGSWARDRQIKYAAEARDRILPIAEKTDKRFASALQDTIADVLAS